jgi:hypothetical protein
VDRSVAFIEDARHELQLRLFGRVILQKDDFADVVPPEDSNDEIELAGTAKVRRPDISDPDIMRTARR